ncbi:MAG: putative ABC transporter ATP-binding protein [Methanomassiliicoccales archaeon PtaU1.Bin124]|nr:MAG: putative ABC transporter ATP-binding protein [Methanomassiliicoccales archaeon PtaU1.Bin124]
MSETVIEVKNLIKNYGDFRAVDGISFEVRKGEVFSILGPNGAGKTTTVEIMECLRKPSSGEVKVLGFDIAHQQNDIRKRVGILPQDFNTYDLLTVKENIDYFGVMFDRSIPTQELLDAVNLNDKKDEYFKNLSGGLKQRVGVAIAMVNDPDIIFLDEPTTGLDPKARREVWEVVKDLKRKGKTVILTTHYMEEAEVLSDRLAIMNGGRFIAYDTPRAIIKEHGYGTLCIIRSANDKAMQLLTATGLSVKRKDGDVEVHMDDKSSLHKVVEVLQDPDAYYDEITVKRSSLEDVFLKLTGKRIEDDTGAKA